MDIALREIQRSPVSGPSEGERSARLAGPRDRWETWSRSLHAGVLLFGALGLVALLRSGGSLPFLARANGLLVGSLVLGVGLLSLVLARTQDRRFASSAFPAGGGGSPRASKGELLLVLDSVAGIAGAWLILFPMIFSVHWPAPGLAFLVLGAGVFLAAEGAQLAELNRQTPRA